MLEHNLKTYKDLKKYIFFHKDCCVVNPCGSGKSTIIESVIRDYENKKIVLVTNRVMQKTITIQGLLFIREIMFVF